MHLPHVTSAIMITGVANVSECVPKLETGVTYFRNSVSSILGTNKTLTLYYSSRLPPVASRSLG